MKDNRITVMLTINKMIIGGAEQQFLELVKGIDKKHFNVIVVTFYPGGDLEPEVKQVPSVEYICLNRKSKLDFSPFIAVFRLLRQKRVDVIQPFLTPATFFTLIPAVFNRTPVKIITERATLRSMSGFGYSLYLFIEDFFTRFADWVIPNSVLGKNFVISRGINPDRIRVIYNGINIKRLVPDPAKVDQIRTGMGLPPDRIVVGISASLTPNKDHVTFLQAARLIAEAMPQVRFAILGDGDLGPMLRNMTRELGIESNVSFLGNQTDMGSYLSIFDIACLCSSQGEGCSNSILEAMACGKPVVATDAGGNAELVADGETGFIVPVRDPNRLAEAILTCLRQPERAREMGQRGKGVVASRFSLERMVKDYEDLYEEVIKHKVTYSSSEKRNADLD